MADAIKRSENISRLQLFIVLVLLFFIMTMGFFGILNPEKRENTIRLTPFIILLCFIAVFFFTRPLTLKTIVVFFILAILGFIIEVIGVNTHMIFGTYNYGKTLGISLFNTPLLIGINWLFLVYTSASLMERFSYSLFLKIVLASMVMLIYDIILEPVAGKIDMWHWNGSVIPLHNYIAWFTISMILHTILKWRGIKINNPVAPWILLCQILFFLALRIFLK